MLYSVKVAFSFLLYACEASWSSSCRKPFVDCAHWLKRFNVSQGKTNDINFSRFIHMVMPLLHFKCSQGLLLAHIFKGLL